tara:strand:- start:1266 stop:1742 length:477 start_codon:yes stop_codon:yes gene_type:complete
MKNIQNWLDAYGVSHQNKTNKMIHWICVPLIMFSLLGILSLVKITIPIFSSHYCVNLSHLLILFSIIFYFRLSISISIGMIIYSLLNLYIIYQFELFYSSQSTLLAIYIVIFIGAWIGQFIGHKIEGQKPSFFEDLQFLLIGPAWLLSFIYKKFGIRY